MIAALFIVFGALGILSLPLNILNMATGWQTAGPMGQVFQQPTFRTYMAVNIPVSGLFAVLYIVSGVGMLQLRPWARKLALGLLVAGLLAQVVNAVVMMPMMSEIMKAVTAQAPDPAMEAIVKTTMTVAMVIGLAVGAGIIVLFIVLLTRPNVRDAFEPPPTPAYDATGYPQ